MNTQFRFTEHALDTAALRGALDEPSCGGVVVFEGRVRNHSEGRAVERLEYEACERLAIQEGERILTQAVERFGISIALCVHRVGTLGIRDVAVWVGVSARHRGEAFAACHFIIDEVKLRVPLWKKEHYEGAASAWVNCTSCATRASG